MLTPFAHAVPDFAARSRAAALGGTPRIAPLHDALGRRHSDLGFHIDTGGRPCFRVLVAREPRLFAPEHAGLRNAGNFYDSRREGLLPWDGAPCFYLLPRSVLHALLPAQRLYYTLVAYDDSDGRSAAYAHAPESLADAAPSVGVDAPALAASLGRMFGTPVHRLMPVAAGALAWGEAAEEQGEDVGTEAPQSYGLAADDEPSAHDTDDDAAQLGAAAAADADSGREVHAWGLADDESTDPGYVDDAQPFALDADDEPQRAPVLEGNVAAAYADDGDEDDGSAAYASYGAYADEPQPAADDSDRSQTDAPAAQSLSDDYDDGYGLPPSTAMPQSQAPARQASARAYEEQAEDHYGAEHELDGAQGTEPYAQPYAQPYADAPSRDVPDMLPDEDADAAHAANAGQPGELDEDAVDIDAPTQASPAAQSYAMAYGQAAPPASVRQPFDIDAAKGILARIMPFESGPEGFARVLADGEFAGRFGPSHPAHGKYHLGLTYGGFPFVQEHGTLGQLLQLMRERDRAAFDTTFPGADELIAVTTTAEGPRSWASTDGFSPRLKPVGGQRLWQEPWLARFRQAGAHPPFQGAQNELAARLYIQPVLSLCKQVGLDTEAALTLVVDRAVQMGAEAAIVWVLEAVTPVDTPAVRLQALARLSGGDLAAFQRAQGLPVTGGWDVATHAALIAALRALPDSPVQVLGAPEMVDALLRHAQGLPWAERMKRLRDAATAAGAHRTYAL